MERKYPTYNERNEKEGVNRSDRQNALWRKEIRGKCEHEWQPVSFVFETQMLDNKGRVEIRQPGITHGRVYCVCMKCRSHTYIETGWAGFFINSPDLLEQYHDEDKGNDNE